ncbi:MAG: hypothetical protein GXP14_01930 [Gammaproteobacteria bacterium]|nr:hypothetical protein [Gammaproteobacteria bacterium]
MRIGECGLLGFTLMLFSLSAYADDKISREIDFLSSEYVVCASYFQLLSIGLENEKTGETSASYGKLSEQAIDLAELYASEQRSKQMATKVTVARYKLQMKDMMGEIENDIGNIAILINKHAVRCKKAMEDPGNYLLEINNRVVESEFN